MSSKHWVKIILGDIQFWVPLVVLVGGLFVLRWIQ
ncbi:MAG: translocated intimin receptor Tir [Gemmatimonadaceae bacterium]